jgi:hypothetical protein
LQIIVKVDDAFFAKKGTLTTILTFFANYEIKHPSCEDECNLDKVMTLLHIPMCRMTISHNIFS